MNTLKGIQKMEIAEGVHVEQCNYKGCTTHMAYECEPSERTIHDGNEFWLNDCHCHAEDRQRFCSFHRERLSCATCYASD